ncbi:MAG TPA: hypothetical protein VEQ11_02695 [Chloroflexota bacterium]|nr:hypothetical protein [Chloroflexota bacterium]
MMWLKGCPKCHGDLYEEPAIGLHAAAARYVSCLQCGHVLSEPEEAKLRESEQENARRASVA